MEAGYQTGDPTPPRGDQIGRLRQAIDTDSYHVDARLIATSIMQVAFQVDEPEPAPAGGRIDFAACLAEIVSADDRMGLEG
jgi:hypothetical protein